MQRIRSLESAYVEQEKEHERVLAALSKNYQAELDAAQQALGPVLQHEEDVQARHDDELANTLAQQQVEHGRELQALHKAHEAALSELEQDSQARAESQQNMLDDQISALQSAHSAQIKELSAHWEQKHGHLASLLEEKENELQWQKN